MLALEITGRRKPASCADHIPCCELGAVAVTEHAHFRIDHEPCTVHTVLCLPRNLHMEVHKVLRLPRTLHMEVHKVLRHGGSQSAVPATNSAHPSMIRE